MMNLASPTPKTEWGPKIYLIIAIWGLFVTHRLRLIMFGHCAFYLADSMVWD